MGGLCSRRSSDRNIGGIIPRVSGQYVSGITAPQSQALSVQQPNNNSELRDPYSFPEANDDSHGTNMDDINDGIPRLSRGLSSKYGSTRSKQAAIAKVSEMSSLLGRAGTAGLEKAVDVLDTLGSSMTNLSHSSNFASGVAKKGIKISILAFEVANTIVKGANLMESLSDSNIRHLKEVVIPSEGVQQLISEDTEELLRIAAADKRDELKVFSGEVVRFGNRCKDPQWHNLDRYFEKLGSELSSHKNLTEEAKSVKDQLMNWVQYTAELYHELHALDRFEQDYRRKAAEEDNSSNPTHRGDSLAILRAEVKSQKKHVKGLKKRSLWSKVLEEVMEKLVDIVHSLHLEIHAAFGTADGDRPIKNNHQKLGSAGLALHYANIITQIDTLVSRSSSIPPSTRDALYQGLPPSIKASLRSKLQSFGLKEELTIPQIKTEMEKTLEWIVPMATNTTKAHHGFGWVGEWANTGSENGRPAGHSDLLRIETLYHADKERTEAYILELVIWLHHLIIQSKAANNGGSRSPLKSPICSPNQRGIQSSTQKPSSPCPTLTVEDQAMLRDVSKKKLTPGISKSQEFDTAKTRLLCKNHRLSKSSSHSPIRESKKDPFPIRRPSSAPFIDFDIDRIKALDAIDRVDTVRGA